MSRNLATATRSQLALQSYLDGLLQEAVAELEESVSLDEFEAAVLEEQVRDARLLEPVSVIAVAEAPAPAPVQAAVLVEAPTVELRVPVPAPVIDEAPPALDLDLEVAAQPAGLLADGRPAWAEEPFECLLFDVAGLTLAVPLI
ncbi:MAG: chemotaxis protein CheW, partial [Pseudomonadales bacterium]